MSFLVDKMYYLYRLFVLIKIHNIIICDFCSANQLFYSIFFSCTISVFRDKYLNFFVFDNPCFTENYVFFSILLHSSVTFHLISEYSTMIVGENIKNFIVYYIYMMHPLNSITIKIYLNCLLTFYNNYVHCNL